MRSLAVEGKHIVGLGGTVAAHIAAMADTAVVDIAMIEKVAVVDMDAVDIAAAVEVAAVAFRTILLVFASLLHLPLSVLTTNQYSIALASAIWHFRPPMPPSSPWE